MSFLTRFKAAAASAMNTFRYTRQGSQSNQEWGQWGSWFNLPSARFDYKTEAGDMRLNSIVASSLGWAVRTFPEPNLVVTRQTKEERLQVPEHPVLQILNVKPNEDDSPMRLWALALTGYMLDGNAYWVKLRGAMGNVVQLVAVPYGTMTPLWKSDGSEFISAYGYYCDGKRYDFKKEDVIHFRFPIDDDKNYRLGMSPMKALLRQVCTDNEAATYTAALVRNMGVIPFSLSPKNADQPMIDPDSLLQIKRMVMDNTVGEHRGEPLVLSGAMDLNTLGMNPLQMLIDKIRQIPEERITAALGIPAVIVGLGAGLSRSTYANMEEAGRQAYEQFLCPTQAAFADTLTRFLLPEFKSETTDKIEFDYKNVKALQENEDALAKRAQMLFVAGIIDRECALLMIGKVPEAGDKGVYYARVAGPALASDNTQAQKAALIHQMKHQRIEWERKLGTS